MNGLLRAFSAQAKAVFKDKGALLLFVLAPLVYSAFYPLPYLNHVVRDVPVGVVDLDQTAQSRQIVRWLAAHPNIQVETFADIYLAETAMKSGLLGGFVILPSGLAKEIAHGEAVNLPVIADAAYFLVYRQVLTAVLEVAGTFGAQVQVGRSMAVGRPIDQALLDRDPHPLVIRPVFNRTESYLPYIVPAVYVLILQQTLLMGMGVLAGSARERGTEKGSLSLSAGLSQLIGRTGFLVFLYSLHAMYFWGWSTVIFELPNGGQGVQLWLLLVPFLIGVSFLAIAIEPLFKEREQAFAYLLFTSLPILFVSGFVWPREAMPGWLTAIATVFPTTPAIEGFLAVLAMDASWESISGQVSHLWLLAALFFLPALWVQCRQPLVSGAQQ